MPKLQVKNKRYSEIKGEMVENPYELECEIVKENHSTYIIYVPEWKKNITVKKDKVYN